MIDVLQLCTVTDERGRAGRLIVEIDPREMYPTMLEYIKEYVDNVNNNDGDWPLPEELVEADVRIKNDAGRWVNISGTTAAQMHSDRALNEVPYEGWELAAKPYESISGDFAHEARDKALECARLWFTRALKKHPELAGEEGRLHIKILSGGDERAFRLHDKQLRFDAGVSSG